MAREARLRIGVDLDNTLVLYDRLLGRLASEGRLIPAGFAGSKREIRDLIRALSDGESQWMELQAAIYGSRMAEAELAQGAGEFLAECGRRGIEIFIVSHKTRFAARDSLQRCDLHATALAWMENAGFFSPHGFGVPRGNVYFELSREAKCRRIAQLGCTHFIDDLVEVFIDPAFPAGVRQHLYQPESGPLPSGHFTAHRSWPEIFEAILGRGNADAEARAVAARLLAKPVARLIRAAPGGNNRIYKVECADGAAYALKEYPKLGADTRDRLGTEFAALAFLRRHGIADVPGTVARSPATGHALYEWIDGAPVERPSEADVDRALALVQRLAALRGTPEADALPLASEACLSLAELCDQVERRLGRLREVAAAHPGLGDLLEGRMAPLLQQAAERARLLYGRSGMPVDTAIERARQTLSPSDFGFHNALRSATGRLRFIDFEYFGWDDPVKLIADFLLHPAMDLGPALSARFRERALPIFQADAALPTRLGACFPLYGLRWCAIILNEFLPERWARRAFAKDGETAGAARARQLHKAQLRLSAVEQLLSTS